MKFDLAPGLPKQQQATFEGTAEEEEEDQIEKEEEVQQSRAENVQGCLPTPRLCKYTFEQLQHSTLVVVSSHSLHVLIFLFLFANIS